MATLTSYLNPTSLYNVSHITNPNNILSNENTYCYVTTGYGYGLIEVQNFNFSSVLSKYDAIIGLSIKNKSQRINTENEINAVNDVVNIKINDVSIKSYYYSFSSTATINIYSLSRTFTLEELSSLRIAHDIDCPYNPNARLFISQVAVNHNKAVSQALSPYTGTHTAGSDPTYIVKDIPKTVRLDEMFEIGVHLSTKVFTTEQIRIQTNLPSNFTVVGINYAHTDMDIFENVDIDIGNNDIIFNIKDSELSDSYKDFRVILQVKMDSEIVNSSMNLIESVTGLSRAITLPNYFSGTIYYTGSGLNILQNSEYIFFNDTEIMPQNEGDVYLDNLNLINYTKSELFDINPSYSNELTSNYAENKGNVQSLLLDSNTITIKLLSDINDFNTLTDVISEIFMNFKTNLRLKLGVLPNKIIPCSLKNIEPELHSSYSYLTFEFEKTQRTPYNHYTLKNITGNQFNVNNYQREPAVVTITGSGANCSISITDQNGTQEMTINHAFTNEIIIDSKSNKVYVDKIEIQPTNLTYSSEFFELRGKCTATLNNGIISKVVI